MNWNQSQAEESLVMLKDMKFRWICPSQGLPIKRNDNRDEFISKY